MKRQVEIEDTLDEIIENVKSDVKNLFDSFMNDNPDQEEALDLYNELDYDGSVHEIVDSSVPIYTGEINDLFYLYGNQFETAFDDAGIGEKNDEGWPNGWKVAAIYCYIEQEIAEWYEQEKDDLYEEWRSKHPLNDGEEESEEVTV